MANSTWSTTDKSASIVLSGGNLIANNSTNSNAGIRGANGLVSGKYFWEVTCITAPYFTAGTGIATSIAPLNAGAVYQTGVCAVIQGGTIYLETASTSISIGALNAGTIVGIALDITAGYIWFRNGAGNWNNSASANPATGVGGIKIPWGLTLSVFPWAVMNSTNTSVSINFGDTAFANPAPAGFGNVVSGGPTIPMSALVTQILNEAWVYPVFPEGRVTTLAVENWTAGITDTQASITMIGVEQWAVWPHEVLSTQTRAMILA